MQVVSNVTNGITPARIVATGYAEGGSWQSWLLCGLRGVTAGSILQVVRNVTNGATPARIVATGYAEGGALAKLAAVWAGAAFAEAQVRSINFGAPRVGNDRWGLSGSRYLCWACSQQRHHSEYGLHAGMCIASQLCMRTMEIV